jgi:hypothetical protein
MGYAEEFYLGPMQRYQETSEELQHRLVSKAWEGLGYSEREIEHNEMMQDRRDCRLTEYWGMEPESEENVG